MTFIQCVEVVLATPELVSNIDRLFGTSLMAARTPLELMIDKATGKRRDDLGVLLWFVWEMVWTRLPNQQELDHGLDPFFESLAASYRPQAWGE